MTGNRVDVLIGGGGNDTYIIDSDDTKVVIDNGVAPINQISTQMGNVIEFDFKADQVSVSFTPTFTSSTLSAEDTAAINLAIQNALRTSFQTSSATLPGFPNQGAVARD